MLGSSYDCPRPNYSNILHSQEGIALVEPQFNYITNIVSELKGKFAKIKNEDKEIQKQFFVIHLSSSNEVSIIKRYDLSISTPFHNKYHF